MKPITIEIRGEPAPQPRPRFTKFGKPYTKKGRIQTWRDQVRVDALPWIPWGPIVQDAVVVVMEFRITRPKKHLNKSGLKEAFKNAFPSGHSGDIDNLMKPVLDVLTEIGLWHDDNVIKAACASKEYADEELPGCTLVIGAIEDGETPGQAQARLLSLAADWRTSLREAVRAQRTTGS